MLQLVGKLLTPTHQYFPWIPVPVIFSVRISSERPMIQALNLKFFFSIIYSAEEKMPKVICGTPPIVNFLHIFSDEFSLSAVEINGLDIPGSVLHHTPDSVTFT